MTIGVYAVINRVNGKAYVGSSSHVEKRLIIHKSYINTKWFFHYQGYAEDAAKYGTDNFEFRLLKETDSVEEARELETAFLECFIDRLYNKAPNSDGATGVKRQREVYVKAAEKRLSDPAFTRKLSESCRGKRQPRSCPHCGKVGAGGNMSRYHFDKCKDKK